MLLDSFGSYIPPSTPSCFAKSAMEV